MSKQTNLFKFMKRKEPESTTPTIDEDSPPESLTHEHEQRHFETQQVETDLIISLERDPGLRPPMWHYPPEKRDEIRRAYLKLKPYQPILKSFPFSGPDNHRRSFSLLGIRSFRTG